MDNKIIQNKQCLSDDTAYKHTILIQLIDQYYHQEHNQFLF